MLAGTQRGRGVAPRPLEYIRMGQAPQHSTMFQCVCGRCARVLRLGAGVLCLTVAHTCSRGALMGEHGWEGDRGTCLLSHAQLLRACCVLAASRPTPQPRSRSCALAENPWASRKIFSAVCQTCFTYVFSRDYLIKRYDLATSELAAE